MGKVKFFIVLCVLSLSVHAANIVDVYGVDLSQSEDIIKNYGAQVSAIQAEFLKEVTKISSGGKDDYLTKVLLPKKIRLIKQIQKQYDLAYVEFEVIFYPNNKNSYTTIEVVGQHDREKLRLIPEKKVVSSVIKSKPDLVAGMIEFQDTAMNLLLTSKPNTKEAKCPVYHCLFGFDDPKLRNSFRLQTQQAIKEKELLINTLKNDPSPQRRTAAAFLIGYLNDPHEIISLLSKSVMDPDDGVRNGAMRVISETMRKAKITEINIVPFLNLLDSPFDTDRNKALFIILNAADSPATKQLIIQKGNKRLISLLRLTQPNNHDIAYAILTKISGRDFGAHNVDAWSKWLDTMNKQAN